MNTGGDGYEMLKEEVPTVPWGLFNDAVADYIKKVKDLKTPEPFQRIIAIP
jgi:hypothetical protein